MYVQVVAKQFQEIPNTVHIAARQYRKRKVVEESLHQIQVGFLLNVGKEILRRFLHYYQKAKKTCDLWMGKESRHEIFPP